MTLAPLSRRVLAGLIDGVAMVLLATLAFLVPVKVLGVALPMWGVLAVMVGWSVVPLAFLQQTAGMRALGLELAGADGHPVDLANVLFRELLGRGLFPAAYLLTLLGGSLAHVLGVMSFAVPKGLGLVVAVACVGAFIAALVGALIGLGRPDGRGLADLMTRSFVVVAPARPPLQDADDRAEAQARRKTVVRRIVVFEVVVAVGVLATPWLLTRRTGETSAARIERIKRQGLEQRFTAEPANEALAKELIEALERASAPERAREVLERHRKATAQREASREALLRDALAKDPGDERTAGLLLELLEDQGRLDEAITAYRAWLGPTPKPSRRAAFGHWLGVRSREVEAIAELRQALTEDPLVPMGHTMLGVVLERQHRLEEARAELTVALLLDPEDEDATDELEEVTQAVGPLSPAERKQLSALVASWTADAGTR